MSWKGIFFGALIGLLLTRNVWGAAAGAIIGYMLDPGAGGRSAAPPNAAASISGEFFRTTFEIMGYVAKSDGRVSEAEIEILSDLVKMRLLTRELIVAWRSATNPAATTSYRDDVSRLGWAALTLLDETDREPAREALARAAGDKS